MQVIQRFLYRELLLTISAVALGFLGLFVFFDFVDELSNIGKSSPFGTGTYGLLQAMAFVVSLVPSRLYDLLPIAVLIGSTFVMARMAKTSEFTILRTGGLSPMHALRLLLGLGLGLVVLTFLVGDYVAPATNRAGQLLKAKYLGKITIGQTGAWLKESQGDKSFAVRVGSLGAESSLGQVRIFEFDAKGRIVSTTFAASGRFLESGTWQLQDVSRKLFFLDNGSGSVQPKVQNQQLGRWDWRTSITVDMVATALLRPDRMSTYDLYQYTRHLEKNSQSAQSYEVEFWRKLFYPISCLVMLVLALPFAYFHFRGRTMTGYVFAGVLIGISFFVVNTAAGYFGNLNNWQPWLTAAAPSMLYSVLALTAFGWLVIYR
jgi:lipopolysaccharide export system permease protein